MAGSPQDAGRSFAVSCCWRTLWLWQSRISRLRHSATPNWVNGCAFTADLLHHPWLLALPGLPLSVRSQGRLSLLRPSGHVRREHPSRLRRPSVAAHRRQREILAVHDSSSFNYSHLTKSTGLGYLNDSPTARRLLISTLLCCSTRTAISSASPICNSGSVPPSARKPPSRSANSPSKRRRATNGWSACVPRITLFWQPPRDCCGEEWKLLWGESMGRAWREADGKPELREVVRWLARLWGAIWEGRMTR